MCCSSAVLLYCCASTRYAFTTADYFWFCSGVALRLDRLRCVLYVLCALLFLPFDQPASGAGQVDYRGRVVWDCSMVLQIFEGCL